MNSEVILGAEQIEIKKENTVLFRADNLKTSFLLAPLITKKFVVNNFAMDYLFADANGLMSLFPSEGEDNSAAFVLDLYDSILNVKKQKFSIL